jgi:tryptophanyl-tRNA synthetase
MTADVLLYKANLVPVGDDQTQHLELARDIAAAFNRNYNVEFFPIPQQLKTNAARVMSLRDGSAKMSKSDPSEFSRIGLIDSYDEISAKIKKAKTDALGSISFDPESRPEVSNLVQIFAELSNQSVEQVCLHFESKNTVEFKNALTELLVEELAPIRKRIIQHQSDMTLVKQVLRNGKEKAAHIAEANMNDIKKIIGLN